MSTKANETTERRKRAGSRRPADGSNSDAEQPGNPAEIAAREEAERETEEKDESEKEKDYRSRTALSRIRILKRILHQLEDKMAEEMGKTSLSDYIRLLQLVREMESEVVEKEIVVQWVQEPQADDDTGE